MQLFHGFRLYIKNKFEIFRGMPKIYDYEALMDKEMRRVLQSDAYPCLIHDWDNTPRCGVNGVVLQDASPEKFRLFLRRAIKSVMSRCKDDKIIFLKSWNEWAEGNYLEPDLLVKHKYLQVIKDELAFRG